MAYIRRIWTEGTFDCDSISIKNKSGGTKDLPLFPVELLVRYQTIAKTLTMVELAFNTRKSRGLLYGLILLSSLVVFGFVAEVCDVNDQCPTRLAVVIGMGVSSAVISLVLFFSMLLDIEAVLSIELLLAFLLLVLWSVGVAIASSTKTGLGGTVALSFAWIAMIIVFIVSFAALTAPGGLLDMFKENRGTGGSPHRNPRTSHAVDLDVENSHEVPEADMMRETPVGVDNDEAYIGIDEVTAEQAP